MRECIILSMIEGTNDGASKGEHSGETDGVHEYGRMVVQVTAVSATDHSFVCSHREVKNIWSGSEGSRDLCITNSVTAGHTQMEVGKVQSNKFFKELQDLFTGRRRPRH
jgi:hypothetical protein